MEYIKTEKAPAAIGPYSQAVVHNGLLFCSGQIPLAPETMTVVDGGVAEQTGQVLQNLLAVLEAAGLSRINVLKTTVFLTDMNSFAEMNQVYDAFFNGHKPARAAVEVSRLPRDVLVEIECIAATQQ
jgi:2-iminobutanoate/2-iminopropanoate deaminase